MSQTEGYEARHILSGVDQCIITKKNLYLTVAYTNEVVNEALKDMGPIKASSIDGFPTIFSKTIGILWGERLVFTF